MTAMYLVLMVIVLFLDVLVSADTCPCKYVLRPDQNKYCESNFVVEATVKNKLTRGNWIKYVVEVDHTFRSKRDKSYHGRYTLLTKKSRDECGVTDLEEGKSYILSGVENKIGRRVKMHLDLCKSVKIDSTKATKIQRENLNNYFKLQCPKCKVELCVSESQCTKSPYKCVSSYFDYTCRNMYSVCHWNKYKCEWMHINKNSSEYDSSCMPRFYGPQPRG